MRRKTKVQPDMGLREQNKLDKCQRIRAAARDLFTRRGFDAATLRSIAKRAGVGLGTLFNYADDKRDLVFLIFNEELDALTGEALAKPRPGAPLVEQLLAIFGCHYRRLGAMPVLSRILLQELTFYSAGKQALAFQRIRGRLIEGIEDVVRRAQRERRILAAEDPALIARHVFFVYSAAIRWWIAAPRPNPEQGLAELGRMLELQVAGLRPAPEAEKRMMRSQQEGLTRV